MKNRLNRINSEVKKVLANSLILLRDPQISGFVTITKVETSADIGHTKVWVGILASNDQEREKTFKALQSSSSFFRRELAHKLNMRTTPEVHFFIDNGLLENQKMEALLQSINIPKEE